MMFVHVRVRIYHASSCKCVGAPKVFKARVKRWPAAEADSVGGGSTYAWVQAYLGRRVD